MFKTAKKALAAMLSVVLLVAFSFSLHAKPLNEDPPDIPPVVIVKPPPPPLSM